MANQLYRFVDTYEYDNSDLTFIINSNADYETMKSIELVADTIWNDLVEEDMPNLSQRELELYNKYYERYVGCSKVEIIEAIVKGEGYTWEHPDIIDIEW